MSLEFSQHGIETRTDAGAYLARLEAFARVMDEEVERVRRDVGLGVVPPDFAIDGALVGMKLLHAPADRSTLVTSLAERAKAVQESFEDRQTTTAEALAELLKEIEKNEQRKKEQAAKGLDGLTYFVLCKLTDDGIPNPEPRSRQSQGGRGIRQTPELAAQ